VDMLDRLPRVLEKLENFVEDTAREGVLLHARSIVSHAEEQAKRAWLAVLPAYIAAAALVAIALTLVFRR